MPDCLSWRSMATADHYRDHDYADFAQEFLIRNPDYKADYASTQTRIAQAPETTHNEQEGLARRWGLSFPTDPAVSPRDHPALWSPDVAPDVVIIETPELSLPIVLPPEVDILAEVASKAERNLVCAIGMMRLRFCMRLCPSRVASAFSIRYDANSLTALIALAHLLRTMRGTRSPFNARAMPTRNRRIRFAQLLAIQDALHGGASARDLAFSLIMPNHRPLAGAVWKGSSERRQVLRLVASARSMSANGYRGLLAHR
jgi:hypothetical protein